MKSFVYLGLCLGLAAMTSSASAASVEFRGSLCIVQASAACLPREPNEVTLGLCYEMRYSPPNIGGNTASTNVTLFRPVGAQTYRKASGSLIGTTYQTVAITTIYLNALTTTATMRISTQTPATLATAKSVEMTGNIKKFDALAGCDVEFRAAGTRHTVN
jgi:hypothetical protein